MLVFKFFSTAKGLTGTEWGAGFIRGGIFLLLGLLFGMIQLQTMICGVNELCGNIYLWWFAIAMITGIISEFTIDPLLGLD